MLPRLYQTHFQRELTPSQFLVIEIVLNLLTSEKQVRLELLARVFTYPIITLMSSPQVTKIFRFTQLTLTCLWFPLITYWLTNYCQPGQKLLSAIDRSQWGCINLFMVSLICPRRAIPLSWSLLHQNEVAVISMSRSPSSQLFYPYLKIISSWY